MTPSSLQTQCPKCRTRFRVTDEQLGIAKGKVRCGHCMDVFNAVEHQVGKTPAQSMPPAGPAPEKPASSFTSDTTEEEFLFADNPEEDAAEGRYAGTKLTFSDDELSDSFRSFDDRDSSLPDEADDEHAENVDESWAEAILDEDSAPEKPAPGPEARPEPEPVSEIEAKSPESEFQQEKPFSDPESPLELETQGREQEPEQAEPFSATTQFGDLRHDPVSVSGHNKSWLRTLLWLIVVLGLVGALIAQIVWFQFDRLSAIPELRPFYEQGCEIAGCELKPLVNIDAIQSRKLVVRTDPENRSQLIVDAVIINRADFQQPFPAIALTFSNLNGDVVAQSIFTPAEYLAGEADELNTMPVETPVRIAISIRDPGRDAVNYNIVFQPYTP